MYGKSRALNGLYSSVKTDLSIVRKTLNSVPAIPRHTLIPDYLHTQKVHYLKYFPRIFNEAGDKEE